MAIFLGVSMVYGVIQEKRSTFCEVTVSVIKVKVTL
jgi:hypothetical protein